MYFFHFRRKLEKKNLKKTLLFYRYALWAKKNIFNQAEKKPEPLNSRVLVFEELKAENKPGYPTSMSYYFSFYHSFVFSSKIFAERAWHLLKAQSPQHHKSFQRHRHNGSRIHIYGTCQRRWSTRIHKSNVIEMYTLLAKADIIGKVDVCLVN